MRKMPRLEKMYVEDLRDKMKERFEYENVNKIPRVLKVVLNMGLGKEAMDNANNMKNATEQLATIAGQMPVISKAKKSVAGFRLREGTPIGTYVTLRNDRMWEFLDRLITFSIPQVRDFRGLSPRGFDGQGNYNFGVEEQAIFPEISVDRIDKFRGMNITIVTSAPTDEEGLELLKFIGMPFRGTAR